MSHIDEKANLLLSFTQFSSPTVVDAEEGHDTVNNLETNQQHIKPTLASYQEPEVLVFGET